jgi:hypothetical protein
MKTIENLRYITPEGHPGKFRGVAATVDGWEASFSTDPANMEWAECLAQGITPADYVPPAPTWASIRGERDALLKSTDWWAVSDRAMSSDETNYRQALRDVPQTFSSPADVVWPTKP